MTDSMSPSAPAAGLTCPKCRGQMRAYERSGVTVDQCDDCRGIFLDRGELERLVDVESGPASAPPAQQSPAYPPQGYPPQAYPPQPVYDQRRGVLDSLFGEHHDYRRRGHH